MLKGNIVKEGLKKSKNKKRQLSTIIKAAKNSMKSESIVINSALRGARFALNKNGGKQKVMFPRILPIPDKIGGSLLFLIPLFAG